MKEKYFEELLQNLDSDNENDATDFALDELGDNATFTEGGMKYQLDSEVELEVYPIEGGHGGDSDVERSLEEEADDADDEVNEQQNEEQNEAFYVGKDGTKWSKSPLVFCEARFVGPSSGTKNLSEVDTFFRLMHATMQSIICRNTNRKSRAVYQKLESERASTSKCRQSPSHVFASIGRKVMYASDTETGNEAKNCSLFSNA
ncbi:uncharacterized protein [Eurosta solidaginis]|uniref:uncharacterized protein n=1 Tax=Eurosta solidaginis TaxID=178769 RepID=UPI0035314A9A